MSKIVFEFKFLKITELKMAMFMKCWLETMHRY
jgi:hypothetical protein